MEKSEKTQVTSILERVEKLKWYWVGHVARQKPNRWISTTTGDCGDITEELVVPGRDGLITLG